MATDKQIAANQANAQLSHGPTSEAGKGAVSQNATKHGLTGRFIFYTKEDQEEYNQSLRRLIADYNVETMAEGELIEKMTQSLWRSRRAVDLQDECIDTLAFETDEELIKEAQKKLELYMRYQTNHDRCYQRYAAELRKLQAEMKKAEIGTVSQKLAEARLENQKLKNQKLAAGLSPADTPQTPANPTVSEPRLQRSGDFQPSEKVLKAASRTKIRVHQR